MFIELEDIFGPGGILAQHLERYEFRPSQLEMARSVHRAITDREHLCAEAGTGTGKTLAYLIPALASEGRVVVSTATRNLQEQLISKDIPLIRDTIMPSLKAVCMKGRANYLCILRLERSSKQGRLFVSESSGGELVRLREWSKITETGDRAELEWLSDSSELWASVDARSEICLGSRCVHFEECFITRMRQQALSAEIIIVNHALFFTNLCLADEEGGGVLPGYSVAILDEAHEVEDIASGLFGHRISSYQLEHLARDVTVISPPGSDLIKIGERLAASSHSLCRAMPASAGRFSLNLFQDKDRSLSDLRRVHSGEFGEIESVLMELYHALEARIEESTDHEILVRRADNLLAVMDKILNTDDENSIYWVEQGQRGMSLNLTPVNVAPVLRTRLFAETDTVVLTSATIKTGGSFEFLRGRLGLDGGLEVDLPGEFDYSSQARLFIPRDLPDSAGEDAVIRQVEYINRILQITEGYAFLLFTSFRQMNRVHEMLRAEGNYPLLLQGEKPKSTILNQFRKTPHCVLCATNSVWQGVDVRGDALRAVVIDKLPFQVPTDPVVSARFRQIKMKGEDPFRVYSIPMAVISLRQGLGRLVRSREDRGIMAVLDSRIWNKWYGKYFLESLNSIPVTDDISDLERFWDIQGEEYSEDRQ